jgi:MFS family permease
MTTASFAGRGTTAGTIETRRSWVVAVTALGILSVSFGAPIITIVALKPIASEFGNLRSVPALSYSLAWLGSAIGGIAMGQVAERIGVRWTVVFGALMIAAGLILSSIGGRVSLYVGHGLLMGLLGNAGLNAPLYVYVARWFDRPSASLNTDISERLRGRLRVSSIPEIVNGVITFPSCRRPGWILCEGGPAPARPPYTIRTSGGKLASGGATMPAQAALWRAASCTGGCRLGFVDDSPLEGNGFELSVPRWDDGSVGPRPHPN